MRRYCFEIPHSRYSGECGQDLTIPLHCCAHIPMGARRIRRRNPSCMGITSSRCGISRSAPTGEGAYPAHDVRGSR
ncbi:hypothetical protein FHX37_3158 [Haloactinospora alba]|uniref:Uncharacterized protein n=1 Tax=Haloactinospora alba TaxID=405555 RepID=A0A543NMV8_9ACTN|nr:hypothetical protein FHX37_3158 [Haloactinospora alba]